MQSVFMKKSFVLLVLTGITMIGSGQQFGIFGGPQMTTAKYTVRGEKQPATAKYGFQLGAGWKIPFENRLFFSPSAYYSLKGYKVKFNQAAFPPDTLAVDNNTSFHTLELAFLLQYDFSSKPGGFFVKFGPSLDFQLSGKEKFKLENNTTIDRKLVFDFGQYGRYGASMVLQLGYETSKGLTLYGHYTHGIGSINNADYGPKILHRAYGISVGKYLTRKK